MRKHRAARAWSGHSAVLRCRTSPPLRRNDPGSALFIMRLTRRDNPPPFTFESSCRNDAMGSTRVRRMSVLWALTVLIALALAPRAAFADDYDVHSAEWNGLRELVRVAQEVGVHLRPSATLDWASIGRRHGLLILYPLTNVDLADLSGFLEDGGRLALLDDFGSSSRVLQWFQVARSEEVRGTPRSPRLPGLLIANPRIEHPLTEGVDTLITNEPAVLSHPRLSPVFALSDDPRQGVVLAGQVERGRLVVGGDPSVLINTMLRFPGNRQFARNLLLYLAGRPGGHVHLVHSRFATRGEYYNRGRAKTPARALVASIDEALARFSALGGDPVIVRSLALLLMMFTAMGMALKIWGSRPSDRFGPTGPQGAAASTAEKVAIFALPRANLLYPTLIAKRYFERMLLRALGLRPPTDVGAVLLRAKGRLDTVQQAELRALLVELDALATPEDQGGPLRVSPARFLSLWRRINAILSALGDDR